MNNFSKRIDSIATKAVLPATTAKPVAVKPPAEALNQFAFNLEHNAQWMNQFLHGR